MGGEHMNDELRRMIDRVLSDTKIQPHLHMVKPTPIGSLRRTGRLGEHLRTADDRARLLCSWALLHHADAGGPGHVRRLFDRPHGHGHFFRMEHPRHP